MIEVTYVIFWSWLEKYICGVLNKYLFGNNLDPPWTSILYFIAIFVTYMSSSHKIFSKITLELPKITYKLYQSSIVVSSNF